MTKEELISRLYQRLPLPNLVQITDISRSENSIYFSWKGKEYKVSTDLMVDQVENSCLHETDAALLIGALLKLE